MSHGARVEGVLPGWREKMLTIEIYHHDAFILTHGAVVKDGDKEVWRGLFSSEDAARKAAEAKAAVLQSGRG